MQLILTNGYPFPLPQDFDSDGYDSRDHRWVIEEVVHFQWLHTLTVEFADSERGRQQLAILRRQGWRDWSPGVLEAPTSGPDGYGHPAIVVGDRAFCGFMVLER